MRTLTKENIRFIDNYLNNSDIVYNDVRLEMVDHIATAIENQINAGGDVSFYEAFKIHMANNKESMLNDYKTFKKTTDKKIIKTLFKKLLSLKGTMLLSMVTFTLYIGLINMETEAFNRISSAVYFCVTIVVLVVTQILCRKNEMRYSALERLMGILVIFFLGSSNLFDFKYEIGSSRMYVSFLLILKSLSLTLPILFLMTAIQFKNDCELKYRALI